MQNEELGMINIERKTLILLVFIPILYTLLFGGLFSRNVLTEVPIIVCNIDGGFESQKLIQNLYDTPELKIVSVETNADDIATLMLKNNSRGAVVIPKNYSKEIHMSGSIYIELVIDNTNRSVGGTVSKAVQTVITNQNSNFNLSTRMLYSPTGGYIDFFLASLIMHSTQIAIVFAIAPTLCNSELRMQNAELNFSKKLIIIIKLLILFSMVEISVISICLSIGISFFDMICRGNFIEIMILNSAFIICMVAFAICIGVLIDEEYKALLTPLAYIMPSIMFANVTWPRHSMDDFSLILSYIMPIGYAADDLRNLLIKGVAVDLQFHVTILLLMASIFFTIALIGVKYNDSKCSARISTSD